MKEQQEIVVLGAGYAGIKAALRLASYTQANITLVNAAPVFVERVRLHQQSTGQHIFQHKIADLVAGSGIKFVQAYVTAIDPQKQLVTMNTADGQQICHYDTLVYALGSMIDRDSVPGVREFAQVFEPDRVKDLHAKLHALPAGARIVICGGGLTGIEGASEIAEMYPALKVTLVTQGDFGAALSEAGREHVQKVFARLGITITDNTSVEKLTEHSVITDKGKLDYDLVLWAGAFTVSKLAREAGITTNATGQIVVDTTLRSVSHPMIYVAGDAAYIADFAPHLRMACATALPMAQHVADNIAAFLHDQPQKPYHFKYIIRCISLGRHDGLVQLVKADDTPRNTVLTGRLGAFVKERICRFAFSFATKGRHSFKPEAVTREAKVA